MECADIGIYGLIRWPAGRRALDDDRLIGQALNAFYEKVRVFRVNLVNPGGQLDHAAWGDLFQRSLVLLER